MRHPHASQDAPYDRALALSATVVAMRHNYIAVECGCGSRRVFSLEKLARNSQLAHLTLAHVALKVSCQGCFSGPDEVHLTATGFGLYCLRPKPNIVWSLPLRVRQRQPSYHLRAPKKAVTQVEAGDPRRFG